MIRRNIQLEDGAPAWLLISQVEHARISGELTQICKEPYSDEVLAAITHHDDGWSDWERAPTLDPVRGCPLSFVEMPIDAAIEIWTRSIEAAHQFGRLAAAIVAGHFLGLASGSEKAMRSRAAEWCGDMSSRRATWIAEWKSKSPSNTIEIADRGQRMLLTADLLSLWLCCDGPVSSVDAGETPNAEMTVRTAAVLGTYHFITQSKTVGSGDLTWNGSLTPWPFARDALNLATAAVVAPVQKYSSWSELLRAGRQMQLHWQLRQTLPTPSKC